MDSTNYPPRRHARFLPSEMMHRAWEDVTKITAALGNAAVYYTVVLLPVVLVCILLVFICGKTIHKKMGYSSVTGTHGSRLDMQL